MKVVFLTRYGRLGASSRLRTYQYLPYLGVHGVTTVVSPLIDDVALATFYRTGKRSVGSLLRASMRRMQEMRLHRDADVIWIEKENIPFWPRTLEKFVQRGKPYVVDYDDAVFHNYDRHSRLTVRFLFGEKIAAVMRGAALVTAGNGYLGDYAWRAGARRVEYLPTVVDLARYTPAASVSRPFTLGWIGSPSTARYLSALAPVFRELTKTCQFRLVAVGSGPLTMEGVAIEVRPWMEESEAADIAEFDVGLMPLPDGPWERGKCGYKLIQYMAMAVPVVASPVGVNVDIVTRGRCGHLATTPKEWLAALTALEASPERRSILGRLGRQLVEREFCLAVTAPRVRECLESVVANPSGVRR